MDHRQAARRALERILGDPEPPVGAMQRVRAGVARRASRTNRRWIPVVAVATALATAGAVIALRSDTPPASAPASPPAVARGAPLSEGLLSLPSGARILVSPGSRASLLSDDASGTLIELFDGSLLTHVEPRDPSRPFVVRTGGTVVEVVGTTFEVGSDAQHGIRVRGYEGTVAVSGAGERALVGAGDVWPPGAPPLAEVDIRSLATVWPEGASRRAVPVAPAEKSEQPAARPQTGRRRAPSFARARKAERAGDFDRALELYRQHADAGGEQAEDALFALARVQRTKLARPAAAARRFREYQRRYPRGRYAQAVAVHLLGLAGDDSVEVERVATRFLRQFPADPRATRFRIARVRARARSGNCAEARGDLALIPADDVPAEYVRLCVP